MRYLEKYIINDLKKKMVFLGGPRQVGKTTLAKNILKISLKNQGLYFNWDDNEDKHAIVSRQWSDQDKLLVFDELHKFKRWKN